MNRSRITLNKHLVAGLVLSMLVLLLVPAGEARAVASAQSCGQWSIVASPSPGSMDILYSTTAISPQDVWAVGRYIDAQGFSQALIEHWNGTRYSIVSNPASTGSFLLAIAAVSSMDVWAVGGTVSGTSSSILIEHWDGANWRVYPGLGAGDLTGVSVLSSTDVWAVGANSGQTVTAHWNGAQWSLIPSPDPGKFGNGLEAVAAISPADVWAVGAADTTRFGFQSLAIHWNGSQWSVVKTPSLGRFPYELRAVSAISANDIWATGDYTVAPGNITLTLTEHWNGSQWRVVSSPSPTGDDILLGVDALSAVAAWAVGDRSSADQNLVLNWNGTSWNIVPSAFRSGAISSLFSVSADSITDVWAVGFDINTQNFTYQTLIEHYCSPWKG